MKKISIGFILSFISFFRNIENCPFFLCRQPIVCRVKQAKKEGGAGIRLVAMPSFSVPRRAGPFLFPEKKNIVNLTALIRTDLIFSW